MTRFERVYTRLSNRVETAKNRNEQVYWKNYRKWYIALVAENKSALRALKKNLAKNASLTAVLKKLESSFEDVFKLETSTEKKWTALAASKQLWRSFRGELDIQVKSEYDVFRNREFEPDPKLCFVLMPFDKPRTRSKPFMRVYKAIKAAVRKAGLKCKRSDEIFRASIIVQDVWEYINKATLVIADLTGRNANVFYEVGLSHALPKKVILLTETMSDVPFDVGHIRYIQYENTDAGRKKLAKDLYRTIRASLK